MNIWQRLILIFGSIVFFIALMNSPTVCIVKGTILKEPTRKSFAKVIDVRTASVRGFATPSATVLLFFALKSKKKD